MKRRAEPIEPLTVLTHAELAVWLKVSERTVDRLRPPSLPLTNGCRRYLLQDVLEWLKRPELSRAAVREQSARATTQGSAQAVKRPAVDALEVAVFACKPVRHRERNAAQLGEPIGCQPSAAQELVNIEPYHDAP